MDYFNRNKEIKNLEERLASLKKRYNEETKHLFELRNNCKIEKHDVDKMARFSFNNVFLKLSKRYENRLGKEEKEAYMAKARYDACEFELSLLEADIIQTEDELNHLLKLKEEFNEAYALNYRNLLLDNEVAKEKHASFKESEIDLDSLKMANRINNKVKRRIRIIEDNLNQKDFYSMMQSVSGLFAGLYLKGTNYKFLDKIKNDICKLENSLKELYDQLYLLHDDQSIEIDVVNNLEYIDLFLACIFSDKDKDETIKDLNLKLKSLEANLDSLSLKLKDFIKIKNKEVKAREKELNKYIAECTNVA